MYDSLIEGGKYKVRLKPKEELAEVVPEYRFKARWFKDYMDGQVGVLCYDHVSPADSEYEVLWEGEEHFWYYKLEHLKILGEL